MKVHLDQIENSRHSNMPDTIINNKQRVQMVAFLNRLVSQLIGIYLLCYLGLLLCMAGEK